MKTLGKDGFFRNLRKKILSIVVVSSMIFSLLQPFLEANATVVDGSDNTLSGANSNFVNLSNSGAYSVDFAFSGTLDPGNTFLVTAADSSGQTTTGSFLSASGGESSGSVLLNFGSGGWREGPLSFTGVVYSGSISTQVVASGMTLTGTFDTIRPEILLSSSAPSTISGAISITASTSEVGTGFTLSDVSLTNATASGFSQTSSTGYSFIVTPTASTGTMTVSVGTGVFSDTAGNPNTLSNTLSFILSAPVDITSPLITITSYASGATVSGFPTLSGTVTDSGGIANVFVNGFAATIGSGTWSKTIYDLTGGINTVTAIATDLSGNTGSISILLNRVSFPFNTNVELSGTTSAVITFTTDLSATGVVLYGTGLSLLNLSATGASSSTAHSFTLTGLLPDTIYYFLVQGQGGTQSRAMYFKTPTVIDVSTASGSIVATSSVYLSGITASGAIFLGSGSLTILSITSSGSSISIPLNGLIISSSGGSWDGVLQAPEVTSYPVNLSLSGYAFTGTSYQIGNANTELIFTGQLATVTVNLGSSLSGQTVRIFRSPDQGVTYAEILPTCVVTGGGDCTFITSQLSRFAFAVPADVMPNVFSFSGTTNAELSTRYISNLVTISGIGGQAAVSITGGEYSINSAPFTTLTGAINSGDTVILRLMSSTAYSTSTNATLTIGGVSAIFTVTTKVASGGGSGGGGGTSSGGGGGGAGFSIDNCPSGDTSPSYYDGSCGTGTGSTTTTTTTTTTTVTSIFTGALFHIPPIFIRSLADVNFRDIGGNWARLYILRLVIRGIIDNAEFYRPDDSLTRAEFLKIVINTAGWNTSTTNMNLPFDDVATNIWYAPYVSLALSRGMITGANASFRPNAPITRAEATKILMTAPGVRINEPSIITFVDLDPTSDLTKYVEAAKSMSILSGQIIDGQLRFRPNDPITRAEIAKVVANAFHL